MAKDRTAELTPAALMARKSWSPLPAFCVLAGDAEFFKREILARFTKELFGKEEPWVRRFRATEREPGQPSLAEVLDDLRTPSFISNSRLVVIDAAEQFITANREALEPFVPAGFSGGHLILLADSFDGRTRLGKAVNEKGWLVSCRKPFDKPPPWQPDAEPWDNDLCRWLCARAREKKLSMEAQIAHAFIQRVGDDLATLAEEMEKLRTYLGDRPGAVDLAAVEAVAGALREDSIFDLVEAYLAADRSEALRIARGLFLGGYHPPKGSPVTDPVGITSMFIGALVGRLRSLRRAHALAAQGSGPEEWVSLKLVAKPFLSRFQSEMRTCPPARIINAFPALLDIDRAAKTGERAEALIEGFLLRN